MQEGRPPSLIKLHASNSVIHLLRALQHTMPDHFQQITPTSTEAEQMTTQRIAAQHLLHLQRQ